MATPTFNLTGLYTTISDCDSTAGWSRGTLEPDIIKQGNSSLTTAIRNDGTATYTPGTALNLSATNTHLRLWFQYLFPATLDLVANGGVQLFVTDNNNNRNSYYILGSDNYEGGWVLMQADLASPDVNGGANLANITSLGYEVVNASPAINRDNTYWDQFAYTTGIEFYGGTTADPVTWEDLALADAGRGIVQNINGVYFVNAPLRIGDSVGTNNTVFDGSGAVAVYYATNESSTFYGLSGTGNGTGTTEIDITNTSIISSGQRFFIDFSGSNVTSLQFSGNTIKNAAEIDFKSGQTVTNCNFSNCFQIAPAGATFTSNSISDYSEATTRGALLWPGGTSVSSCGFTNCDECIEITQTTAQTFDDLRFDDVTGKFDVHLNNGGTSITISNANGTNANSFTATGGGTVTFVNSKTLTINNIQPQTEVRIYEYTDAQDPSTYTELVGAETVDTVPVGSTFDSIVADPNDNTKLSASFAYDASGGNIPVVIVAHNLTFEFFREFFTLDSGENTTFTVFQTSDRQYI